jgi:hypothetical protein
MNHPAISNYTENTTSCQNLIEQSYQRRNGDAITSELKATINNLLDNQFRHELQRMKHHTGAGYLTEPLWRAYMLSFILNMDCTNDLIRRLEESPNLIELCGFDMDKPLPSRWAFDRFIISLAEYPEPIERLLDRAVDQLHQLPDFGVTVAADSTPVRSHSNPEKKVKSDPEADFIVKEGNIRKVWKWGYKLHLLVDTVWELPIACEVTLARESDVTHLIPLLNKARQKFTWFKPWHIVADKGYDAGYNYKAAYDIGAIPIIKMKERPKSQDGRYSLDETGIPHCRAALPLLLLGHDRKKGMKYVCPHRAGKTKCSLLHQCTLRVVWIRPFWEYRKFCSIPRDSDEWNEIYSKRSAIERVNSKLKEHRRLDSHCHRGLLKVKLHCLMSVLSLAITALAEINANRIDRVRACTRKIA